ncbi:MAG: phosphatase PAP2 family protein [Verrucomicrobiota bacterium]
MIGIHCLLLPLVFPAVESVSAQQDAEPKTPALARPAGVSFSILPPPPADDTPAGLADLNVVLYLQSIRTPEMTDMAHRMASSSVFAMDQPIFGAWFTRENLPRTTAVMREATMVTDAILAEAKAHWNRPRPYMRSPEVSPVVNGSREGSYPSGHTFGAAIPQFILSEAFPEHAAALDARIREVMWGRVVGGVHFPTDTEAGRLLARAAVTEMAKTPAMRESIEIIRKEAAPFIAAEKARAAADPAKTEEAPASPATPASAAPSSAPK